jgi:Tfp pilus assembly protein PilE
MTIDSSGNVNIDSNTLYVDATNNRVGIGTSSPGNLLHVESSFSGTLVKIKNNAGSTSADTALEIESSTTAAKTFLVKNAGTERFYVKGDGTSYFNGSVGIGITAPSELLSLNSSSSNAAVSIRTGGASFNSVVKFNADDTNYAGIGLENTALVMRCSNSSTPTERARIDSSGRLLVGTSSSVGGERLQISDGTTANTLGLYNATSSVAGAGTTINFRTDGGATGRSQASISGQQEAAYASGGRLVFSTTADGAPSPTEAMRITSGRDVFIGKTASGIGTVGSEFGAGALWVTRSAGTALRVNRLVDDGTLVEFLQASVAEGTISVSGTTVSYNGAHLSRWSQLPGGAERTEILRGTVLSNIDEMCDWGEEANEQLNRMKVSDVEGDPNVSGVFQAWDDDDDTYTDDFYCAMTGDFIIRIAEGVTVQRGDLLMSAGDGTAKPQDDDIIRSKTIAKVTSTHVTCTYDDGSYCVPCVLMAC